MGFSYKVIPSLVIFSLSACAKKTNTLPVVTDTVIPTASIRIDSWTQKGSSALNSEWYQQCTGNYGITIDNVKEPKKDYQWFISLLRNETGSVRLGYYPASKKYTIEYQKCPNEELERVKGYLEEVKDKYPQAVISDTF